MLRVTHSLGCMSALGIVAGVAFYLASRGRRGEGMLAGLEEFLLALLSGLVAIAGCGLALAGWSGRRGAGDHNAPQARASSSQRA